jgi:hypothetical protein
MDRTRLTTSISWGACLRAALLLASPAPLLAADLAFSVDRWPCGTNPKVGAAGASAAWEGGVLTVRYLAYETNTSIVGQAGSSLEQRGSELILAYTEQQKPQAGSCAAPAVLTFVVTGLERKPEAVSILVRRELKRIEIEG